MALFPITHRKMTVRAMPRFPARVSASGGVAVTKSNGEYAFTLDFASLTEIGATEDTDAFVVQRADGSFAQIAASEIGGAGSVADFIDLGDVPSSYTSQSLKAVRVNAGETALEFVDLGTLYQPLDADLTTWAGVTSSANGRSLVSAADYAAMRALLDLEAGTDFYSKAAADAAFQPLDGDLTSIAALTTTTAGRSVLTIADPNADRVVAWDDTAGGMAAIALADLTDEGSPTTGDYVLIYGAEGDLRKANWSTLPGAGGGLANIVEDTTPQLGGDLDANGFDIQFDDATGIRDDSDNEQLLFGKTASAVNYWLMTNSATGGVQRLAAAGGDSDIAVTIASKGTDPINFEINGGTEAALTASAFSPGANDGNALGATGTRWADAFLADGGVLDFGASGSRATITHTAASDSIVIAADPDNATATSQIVFSIDGTNELILDGSNLTPGANDGNALGVVGTRWADLFVADGAVIDMGASGSRATLTHVPASDSLTIAADPDNATASTQITFSIDGTNEAILNSTSFTPGANDGNALGTTSLGWADLHLATGGVINWANGEVTITESDANTLAFAGGVYTFDGAVRPSSNDAAALGSDTVRWADGFFADGAVLNLGTSSSKATITHTAASDSLVIAADPDNATASSQISFTIDGTTELVLNGTNLAPGANDGNALGVSGTAWSDLFLADGGVINFAAGNATLTHSTGLITSNVAFSIGTSNVLTAGTIELGHASANTLSGSGGILSIESVAIPTISSTHTLTNKRITPRVGSTTSSATPTINTDNVDIYQLTAQTADITSFTTNLSGTPTEGQKLIIEVTGTASRAITWGASFEASTVALPTTTSSTNKLSVGFMWNGVTSKWRCMASA